MFCSRRLNHKINKLHERALRMAYNDYNSSFEDLLDKDCTVTIHKRNLRSLATEMYKISKNLCPMFMNDLMTELSIPYNTRSTTKVDIDSNEKCDESKKSSFLIPKINTVSYGNKSVRYLGPKIWELMPDHMKDAQSLEDLKSKVKILKFEICPSNLCKYIVYLCKIVFKV